MKFLLLLCCSCFSLHAFGQVDSEKYIREMNRIDRLIQIEMDSGRDMLASQKKHYHKMDSLRIVIYKEVKIEEGQNRCVGNEEWLTKRIKFSDSLWGNLYITYDTSRDSRMILYSELSEFTRSRINCLLQ